MFAARLRPWALLLFACCAGLVGCGRADDRRAVSSVAESFMSAVQRDAGADACALLTRGAADAVEHDERKPCSAGVRELEIAPSAVARAEVFGTAAKVDLADGTSAFLELTARGWRLSAAGCRPEPAEHPYTCEVEA